MRPRMPCRAALILLFASIHSFAQQPATSRPNRIRVSQGVAQGNIVEQPQPKYPKEALRKRIEGPVVVKVIIGTDGVVNKVELKSGDPILAEAAENVVKKWRYRPYLLHGEPVEVETQVTVNFNLQLGIRPGGPGEARLKRVGGSVVGNVYRNEFFGIQCALPEDFAFKTSALQSRLPDATTVLMFAVSEPSAGKSGRSIGLTAEDTNNNFGKSWSTKTGADYLAKVTHALEKHQKPSGPMIEIPFGKLVFHRQDYVSDYPDRPPQRFLATIEQGHVLVVVLVGRQEDQDSMWSFCNPVKH